jgi:hypothetical protein
VHRQGIDKAGLVDRALAEPQVDRARSPPSGLRLPRDDIERSAAAVLDAEQEGALCLAVGNMLLKLKPSLFDPDDVTGTDRCRLV